MSDTTLRFELVCPEGLVLEQDVDHVLIPGSEGDFMVLVNHAPIISTLRPGLLSIKSADHGEKTYYVSSGLAEVSPTSLTVLAPQALDSKELESDFFTREIAQITEELESSQDALKKDSLTSQLNTMRAIATSLDMAA